MSLKKKEQTIYILWDEDNGLRPEKLYLDKDSADIGLSEEYTSLWIYEKRAKVETVTAVSYHLNPSPESGTQ